MVSEEIELPDIGELLMYPAFIGISAENFLKHGTDFQRYLLGRIPFRNDKKNVLVSSGVWLLEPGTRSNVDNTGDWHFDTDPRVFILSSPCSALTEFNVNPLTIGIRAGETPNEVAKRIRSNPQEYCVVGRKIDPCRVYMFDNHLHRAVDPKRIEFRFFVRAKETDQPALATAPIKELFLRVLNGPRQLHIEYGHSKVSIYLSGTMKSNFASAG